MTNPGTVRNFVSDEGETATGISCQQIIFRMTTAG